MGYWSFQKALEKTVLCDPNVDEVDLSGVISEYFKEIEKPYACDVCDKRFKSQSGYYSHKKRCAKALSKKANEVEELREQVSMLTDIVSKLSQAPSQTASSHQITNKTNCHNNTIIQNNTIHVNAFSHEEVSHIIEDKTFMDTVLRRREKGLIELIKAIYFDRDNHPENNTVRVTNYRNGLIDTFNGKRWIKCDKSDVLEDMLDTSCSHIDEHYEDVKDVLINKFSRTFIELIREFMDRVKDRDQHTKFFEELKRRIHLLIVNESGIQES